MRTILLLCLALLLVEGRKKPNKKPNKPNKPKPTKCSSETVNKKKSFYKWTETTGSGKNVEPVLGETCWWDLTRTDCAKCLPGGAPCGYPMHQWCQSAKKDKKKGCPGVPENKFTKSSRGYPCYANPDRLDCAICARNRIQCKETGSKCGNHCSSTKDLKCDGILQNCYNIPTCGVKASCDKKTRQCKCDKNYPGNGIQCVDTNTGFVATNPADQVEVTLDTESKFWVYPGGSDQFPTMS